MPHEKQNPARTEVVRAGSALLPVLWQGRPAKERPKPELSRPGPPAPRPKGRS
jgi:hypothetical protein